MPQVQWIKRMVTSSQNAITVFAKDVGHGLLEVSHNMLALVGLLVIAAAMFAAGRADLRLSMEREVLGWLQERHGGRAGLAVADYVAMPDDPEHLSLARALAVDPAQLTRQQAAVTTWLSRRYRVAPEPVARIVQEAWHVGQKAGVEPIPSKRFQQYGTSAVVGKQSRVVMPLEVGKTHTMHAKNKTINDNLQAEYDSNNAVNECEGAGSAPGGDGMNTPATVSGSGNPVAPTPDQTPVAGQKGFSSPEKSGSGDKFNPKKKKKPVVNEHVMDFETFKNAIYDNNNE
jgi:hypothetical protein